MDVRAATTGTGAARRGRRLPPHEREQMILDEAINFFAEYGFNGQVRQLAERLHVSQALIFRYFGTKDALIERVYQRTFLARWDPAWEITLADQSIPLRTRLKTFLKSYLSVVDDYRWIRISMHSSLAQHDLTQRYVQIFVTNILKVIARQVRLYRGEEAGGDISTDELELVWHLHSTVVYYLVRKHIHKTPVTPDIDRLVGSAVDNFIDGLCPERPGNHRIS
jgi:AcrR family transcriptional regulator